MLDADSKLVKALTLRYVLALSLVALFSTGAWVSLKLVIDAQDSTAALVNVSGRQRMLSQRLAMLSHEMVRNPTTTVDEFKTALALMARSHQGLTHGDDALKLPATMSKTVRELYHGPTGALDEQVTQYLAQVNAWLAVPDAQRTSTHPALQALVATARGPLLPNLDRMVGQYQKEGEAAVAQVRLIETAIWLATLLLLVLEAVLIFHPIVNHVKQVLARLQASKVELLNHQTTLAQTVAERTADLAEQNRQLLATEQQLAAQVHWLKQREDALDCIEQGILIAGADRKLQFVNKGFERLTGYRSDEVMGRTCNFLQGPDTQPEMAQALRDAVTKGHSFRGEVLNYRRNGEQFWNDLSINPVHDDGMRLIGFVGVQHDVTPLKQREQAYWNVANHDHLTGLPNRQLLRDRWAQALARAQRNERWGAALFIDLNRFKALNDGYGHEYGDQLLIQTAQRVVQSLREADTVARVGGDEFVLLLSDLDASSDIAAVQAAAMAEKIRVHLAQPYDLVLPANPGAVLHWTESSASVGWALFNGNDVNFDTVLHRADQSMYQVKRAGQGDLSP
ncbi:MAG: diguanylate cyclase [Burkholderiales bacterium]|nr:diguanylate cyclase [Burkholderiales bacterium]